MLPWHRLKLGICSDDAERRHGRHRGDGAPAGRQFVHDHVAGQQESDFQLRVQRAIRQGRVARAEDHVLAEVAIELLLERLLHIDGREHAEALRFRRRRRVFHGTLIAHRDLDAQAISGFFHSFLLSQGAV